MKNILTINSVSKMYKNGFLALKDISFSVGKEEIFALLGPNGAGKTTLISAVCGILKQSSGEIAVKDDTTKVAENEKTYRPGHKN